MHGGGQIDRRTGEVWPQPAIDYAVEMGGEYQGESESSERWLRVECHGSVESYRDIEFSLALSKTPARRTVSPLPSTAAAPSEGSETHSMTGRRNWTGGTQSPRSGSGSGGGMACGARILRKSRAPVLRPSVTNDPLPHCRQRRTGAPPPDPDSPWRDHFCER